MDLLDKERGVDSKVTDYVSDQESKELTNYSFSEEDSLKPLFLEQLSKAYKSVSWNVSFANSLLFNAPFLNSLKSRANQTIVNPHDKRVQWQHLIGPALAGYVLGSLPREKVNIKKVVELSCKTTIAIMLVDNYVDETKASNETKLSVINKLRLAFESGYEEDLINIEQLNFAYKLASEVHLELNQSDNYGIFLNEVRRLAEVAEEQLLTNKRSLAGSIRAGARSLAILACIPMVLNEDIPRRFLKSAKHFGAMMEIADDLHDRKSDISRGSETFATKLAQDQTHYKSLPPLISEAFVRQAKKCFQYLTLSERDGYLFLWRTLKLKWGAFNINSSQVTPPTNYKLAGPSIESKSTFRAISEHGSYWGPLFIQPRIGKGGKIFKFYKLRTMKPFGDEGDIAVIDPRTGKQLKNKRTTFMGSFMRKFFLDELPQIVNLLKGDLNLLGIRPRPAYQFNKLDSSIQSPYLRNGPGAIDVSYAFDLKATKDDPDCSKQRLKQVEEFYNNYEKRPWRTTFRYIAKIAYNILVKGKRGV